MKGSNSTISSWKQRDHAFNDNQLDNSNEVSYVNSTLGLAKNYTEHMNITGGSSGPLLGTPAATPANASSGSNSTANANSTSNSDASTPAATTPAADTSGDSSSTTPAAESTADSTPAASGDTEASATLVQKKKSHKHKASGKGNTKDIAENDVDPWVYDIVNDNVEHHALGRQTEAPKVDKYWLNTPSTSTSKAQKLGEIKGLNLVPSSFIASNDIAETHIDPWVYDKVDPNVEWAALQPRKPAPKVDKYW